MRVFCFIVILFTQGILCMNYPLNDLCNELYSKQLISRPGYFDSELEEMKKIIDAVDTDVLKNWGKNLSPSSYCWYLFPLGEDLMIVGKRDIGADMILYSSQHIDPNNYVIKYLVEEKGKGMDQITKEDIKKAFTEIYS